MRTQSCVCIDRAPSLSRIMIPTCFSLVRWDLRSPHNQIAGGYHRVGVDTQKLAVEINEAYGLCNNREMRILLEQCADNLACELKQRITHAPIPMTYEGALYVIDHVRGLQTRTKIQKLREVAAAINWSAIRNMNDIPKAGALFFIKAEGYPGKTKPPRLICNPQEGEKLLMMMAFWPIMHAMFATKYCTKLIPEHKRPRVITERLGQGTYFVADYTSFECVPNKQLMQSGEHRVLKQLVAPCYHFLFERIENGGKLYSRQDVVMRTPAVQYSGRYTTSLSNTIRNKLLMDTVSRKLGVSYRGVFEGDDSLTSWDDNVSVDMIQYNLGLIGVTAEISKINDIGKAGYCSMYWDAEYNVIAEPTKVCATFPFTNSSLGANAANIGPLLSAKSMSLAYRAPGCPILNTIARTWISDGVGLMDTRNEYEVRWFNQFSDFTWKRNGQNSRRKSLIVNFNRPDLIREPTVSQRLLFYEVFGIPVADQIIAEQEIAQYKSFTPTVAEILRPSAKKAGYDIDELKMIYSVMINYTFMRGESWVDTPWRL